MDNQTDPTVAPPSMAPAPVNVPVVSAISASGYEEQQKKIEADAKAKELARSYDIAPQDTDNQGASNEKQTV